MHRPFRAFLTAAVFAAFASRAPADISAVLPLSVAEGTKITVTGEGFGKSPTAQLVNGPDRISVKRSETPKPKDTQFQGTVGRGPVGTYDLDVKPKGGSTMHFFGIVFEPPTADSLSASSAKGGATLTLFGSFLGKSKGSVTVGGAPASVKSWDAAHGKLRFKVPLGLPVGDHAVVVRNRSGAASSQDLLLTITATGGNGESAIGTFGTLAFVADQPNIHGQNEPSGENRLLTMQASFGNGYPRIPHMFVQGEMPKSNTTYPITVAASVSFQIYDYKQKRFIEAYSTLGRSGTMTIDQAPSGYLVGSFTGSLDRGAAGGTLGTPITGSGTFRAKIK